MRRYQATFWATARRVAWYRAGSLGEDQAQSGMKGKPFIENFEWTPQDGSRFIVINKVSGQVVVDALTEAFFVFHHVNAFERGDELIIDLIAYPNDNFVKATYLDQLRADEAEIPGGELLRYR